VGIGDALDGQTVRGHSSIGPRMLHGTDRQTVGILVDFQEPPTRAIYRASFPTTATPTEIPALSRTGLAVLVFALVALGTWSLARR
jgi:hypothetical protein